MHVFTYLKKNLLLEPHLFKADFDAIILQKDISLSPWTKFLNLHTQPQHDLPPQTWSLTETPKNGKISIYIKKK